MRSQPDDRWPGTATRLDLGKREAQRLCSSRETLVIGRQLQRLALAAQEIHRCEVQRVKRPHGQRKWQERAREHARREFKQTHSVDKMARIDGVRGPGAAGMNTIEHLDFEQTARNESLGSERIGGRAALREQPCQQDRGIEIDQRSARLTSRSRMTSLSSATGLRRGSLAVGGSVAGVRCPCLISSPTFCSAGEASARTRGATTSTTTRPRSVTSTVSPAAAARMYSLSLVSET